MTTNTGEQEEERRDIPSDSFAARLVLVRHHAGRLSIEQAAIRAGVHPEAWRRWEDGARPRDRIETSQTISEKLGIDLDWLMFGGPLLGAMGRPAKRSESDTVHYHTAPRPAVAADVRPSDLRPKGRGDRSHPMSSLSTGRRAAMVRTV